MGLKGKQKDQWIKNCCHNRKLFFKDSCTLSYFDFMRQQPEEGKASSLLLFNLELIRLQFSAVIVAGSRFPTVSM